MDPVLIAEIIELGAGLLKSHVSGKVQEDAAIVESLTSIALKGERAYQDHTGQPLDASLIKVEPLIP